MLGRAALRNRRSFAVLQRLGDLAGTGLILGDPAEPLPQGLSESQQAMAIAEAANDALDFVIETAGKQRRVYKAMTPDNGAQATLFLGHAVTAIQLKLARAPGHHLSSDRLDGARASLREYFPWTDEDEAEVAGLVEGVDADTAEGKEAGDLYAALGALRRIVGQDVAQLPGFSVLFGAGDFADSYTVQMSWSFCFNHVSTRLLGRTDPDGLARFQARSRT